MNAAVPVSSSSQCVLSLLFVCLSPLLSGQNQVLVQLFFSWQNQVLVQLLVVCLFVFP